MLRRSIHFVHAAREALGSLRRPAEGGREAAIEDAALEALRWGLPQRAQGRAPAESALLALHRHALELAGESLDSPLARLRGEARSAAPHRAGLGAARGLRCRAPRSRRWWPTPSRRRTCPAATCWRATCCRGWPSATRSTHRRWRCWLRRSAAVLDFERDPAHRMQLTRAELARFNAMLAAIARLDAIRPASGRAGQPAVHAVRGGAGHVRRGRGDRARAPAVGPRVRRRASARRHAL